MFNTQALRDHAALIRKMDAIANKDRMVQTHEATARLLDSAASEIERLTQDDNADMMRIKWECRSCGSHFTFGEMVIGQAGSTCPACESSSMRRVGL